MLNPNEIRYGDNTSIVRELRKEIAYLKKEKEWIVNRYVFVLGWRTEEKRREAKVAILKEMKQALKEE